MSREHGMTSTPVDPLVRHHLRCKPGKGWSQTANCAVWDHASGLRLHLMGMLRMPDGTIVSGNVWPEAMTLTLTTRMAGGNRKRGLMLWALLSLRDFTGRI